MNEIRQILEEAERAGITAAAMSNAITTAAAVMLFVDFADWRAWCDARGMTSGPRGIDTFRTHGQVLAMMLEELNAL